MEKIYDFIKFNMFTFVIILYLIIPHIPPIKETFVSIEGMILGAIAMVLIKLQIMHEDIMELKKSQK